MRLRASSPDLCSLISGIAVVALGLLLVLDVQDVIDLGWGYLWPALLAAAGAALFTSGLRRSRAPGEG